jgi:hypothetical protein
MGTRSTLSTIILSTSVSIVIRRLTYVSCQRYIAERAATLTIQSGSPAATLVDFFPALRFVAAAWEAPTHD